MLSDASDADTIPFRILSEAQDYALAQANYDHVWVVDAESHLSQDEEELGPSLSLFKTMSILNRQAISRWLRLFPNH